MADRSSSDRSDSFTESQLEAYNLRARFVNRIPVMCLPRNKNTTRIEKSKFLVPSTMMYAEFKYILQKHLVSQNAKDTNYVAKNATIFLYVGDIVPVSQTAIGELYRKYGSDGILYMTYANENTLG
ncbi:Autophagy-related protein 8 [Babesia sp. Xinjiang]|uniref:Autophagy-related protein 8 n=1 Tax=Babesia sp. Xinjiang TaxID=462227 RepID=UPI000A23DE52|nr:Autophagy-related protein 8 [Babesia sp. Xinjiang]ORM41961.1 Autophagy-related protein 8 [Babesia sp. Xinjiang]